MGLRALASTAALSVIIGVASPALVPAAAQVAGTTTAAANTWTSPRTPWGDPDLQGMWNTQTITPFERPTELTSREFLRAEEAAALEARASERREDAPPREGDPGTYNQFWSDAGVKVVPTGRTSLVIDPPSGKIPWKPGAQGLIRGTADADGPFDSWVDLDTGERCITDGPTMAPSQSYNMNFRFLQTPEYVVIVHEMFSNRTIIPLDGRPRPNIGQWLGNSRGHWEGNTLVVETTNFADKTQYRWGRPWRASRSTLHLVERFTRVNANTIDYQFTITDPTMFTSPWTAAVPMTKTTDLQFENACHEGNYSIANVLRGARAREKE